MRAALGLLLLFGLAYAPLAAAEFGPESADGWPVNVDGEAIHPPYAPVIEYVAGAPLNKVGPFTFYPYYPMLTAEVQRLARDHPDLVKLTSAGKSTLGLDIWLLEIANFKDADMILLESREVIYLDGGTHSNEYSGVYFTTEVLQFLLDEYSTNETAKWIVDNRHVHIVPMVNPDGSNAFGRLNAKTVNVNRNYPALWGAVKETPVVNNPGPSAGSEPETKIVMALMEKLRPDYVNSIHCCGNLWLHPWGVESEPAAPDLAMFTRTCDEVFADVRKECGPIWSTIYPASGTSVDQAYLQTGAAAWSFEMSGRGKVAPWGQPAIIDSVRVQEKEAWHGIMHAMLNVEKYGAHPTLTSIEGDAGNLRVTITNDGYGNLTSGTLRLGASSVVLPRLAPGESVELFVPGSFSVGALAVQVDYVKREMMAPMGVQALAVPLVQDGRGLVGVLSASEAIVPLNASDASKVPAPGMGLVLLATAAALGLAASRPRGKP